MTPRTLEASLRSDRPGAESTLGLALPDDWFAERPLMALRLEAGRADPEYRPWSLRAIGLAASGTMIGHIGFHTRPDPGYLRTFVADAVELGYTIYPPYRRRGYAVEALRAMVTWAARQHGVANFVISVAPDNLASTAMAARLGFQRIGKHLDEIDGIEHVYVLRGPALAQMLDGIE